MRAAVLLIVLLLCAPPVFAQSAKSTLTDPDQAAMFNRISDHLVCQCGCGMILRVCNHFECPSAIPMRAKIEDEIRAGMGEQDIIDGFVAEYGKVVLSTPPPEGINLAAWVMPGFMVMLGLFAVSLFTASMVTRHRLKAAPAAPAPPDPHMVDRIEEELKKMDK